MDSPSPFYRGIQSVLKSWTALQLAVSHGFGGPHSAEKADWLIGVIENFFAENDNLEQWELDEFIAQILSEELETVLEDGSLSQVTKEIFTMYLLCTQNKMSELQERLQNLPQVDLSECVNQSEEIEPQNTNLEKIHEEEMESLSLSQGASTSKEPKTAEDDDGWTMVTRSRTKRKS